MPNVRRTFPSPSSGRVARGFLAAGRVGSGAGEPHPTSLRSATLPEDGEG